MHLGYGVLNRHGDVLLGDVRCSAGAAVAAIEMDYVRPRVVAAHGHHVGIGGSGDLHGDQRPGIDLFDPVHVLLVVLDRVDTVERER